MTTMLEKAARALAKAEARGRVDLYANNPELYTRLARAVLLAIRDVPPVMAEAAATHVFGPDPLPHEVMNFDGGWTAMIDAILTTDATKETK